MKRLVFCLIWASVLPLAVSAHVLDEYVQSAQLALAPNGVHLELRLTSGVEVASRVLKMIDVNGDGQISQVEEQAYAERVIKDLRLEVDGHPMPLSLTRVQFPSARAMKEGVGTIQIDLWTDYDLSKAGDHQLSLRNEHLPKLSAYLANTLVPRKDTITITGQQRDTLQRELKVSFQVAGTAAAPLPDSTAATTRPLWPKVLVSVVFLALLSIVGLMFSLNQRIWRSQ